MLNLYVRTILCKKKSYPEHKIVEQEKTVCMPQDYNTDRPYLFNGLPNGADADTLARPSEEVLRNILGFARCYQTVETGEAQVHFFLN